MMKQDKTTKSTENETVESHGCDAAEAGFDPMADAAADNVSDESFDVGDNTAQLADAAAEWQDRYVRLAAEFDNYRKRTLRERIDLIATASEEVVQAMLPVLDDMERALAALEKSDDIESAIQGMRLICQKFCGVLQQKGLSEIPAVGQPLDTDLHDAVAQLPVMSADEKGKIVDVVQKGYKLKEKVIRHSKVVVGK